MPTILDYTTTEHSKLLTAIQNGDIKVIRQLHIEPPPNTLYNIPASSVFKHAKDGKLGVIKFLHQNGYTFVDRNPTPMVEYEDDEDDITIARIAVKYNHYELIKYIIENKGKTKGKTNNTIQEFKIDKKCTNLKCTYLLEIAARHNRLKILKYLHAHGGCTWDDSVCSAACENDHLNMLTYLHNIGCPWHMDTFGIACEHGSLKCLKYLHVNGCDYDHESFEYAVYNDRYKCVEYLINNINLINNKRIPRDLLSDLMQITTIKKLERIHALLKHKREQLQTPRRIGKKQVNVKVCKDDCAICLEPLDGKPSKGGFGQLECSHCFHVDCLFNWYDKGKTACPLCRTDFVEHNDEMLRGGTKHIKSKARVVSKTRKS